MSLYTSQTIALHQFSYHFSNLKCWKLCRPDLQLKVSPGALLTTFYQCSFFVHVQEKQTLYQLSFFNSQSKVQNQAALVTTFYQCKISYFFSYTKTLSLYQKVLEAGQAASKTSKLKILPTWKLHLKIFCKK